MKEPLWLTESFFYTANAELVQLYGGLSGACRENVLHSTINRARQLYHYQDSDLFDLAAAYGFGIIKNHPFVDGNKRMAFVSMYTFLYRNGWELVAEQAEIVAVILEVATKLLKEQDLAKWLREHAEQIRGKKL